MNDYLKSIRRKPKETREWIVEHVLEDTRERQVLKKREGIILLAYYNLDMSIQNIASDLKLSRIRVYQIRNRAIYKLVKKFAPETV